MGGGFGERGGGNERVYEVYSYEFVFDEDFAFSGGGDWQVSFVLQDFWPAGFFDQDAFHCLGDGG